LSDEEDEMEELRRRKLEQMQRQMAQQNIAENQQRDFEAKKYEIMRKILSQEGRQRLENIRMVKPQLAEQIELQLIQLAQAGRLKGPLSDADFVKILKQITGQKKEFSIKKFDSL